MAHARLSAEVVLLALAGCGGPATEGRVASKPVELPEPPAFAAGAPIGRYHSTRFGVSLPLPSGKSWRIEDHHTALLRATHAETMSTVELAVWHADELVNHARCEDQARDKRLGERAGEEVESELAPLPNTMWDTLVWVGAEDEGKGVATGHLFAFGANVHKCLYFHFVTHGPAVAVSDRLALTRVRILGDLRLDSFTIPREVLRPTSQPGGRGTPPR